MKKQIALLIALVVAATSVLTAGPLELEPKAMAPPTITDDDHWHFNIGVPGWFAFVKGDIGLHGVSSHPNIGFFNDLLTHFTGITSISADVRKGRWGVYGDLLYMSLSEGIYGDGLVKKANLTVDSYIADGEIYYRVLQGPNGWLDARAGARYFNTFNRLGLTSNDSQVNQAAAQLVAAANRDLRDLLERLIHGALDPDRPNVPFPPLGADEKRRIVELIRHARQNPATAQQRIVSILQTQLNSGHGLTEYWADPYIGVGGRYNLNKAFYLTGKADVGGFDVGSIITVQGYGGLGYQYNRNIYAELGFRFLYYDYDSDGFLYKVWTYGPQITVGAQF